MASLAATSWPKPIPLVPCLSWSTASPVFTQGVMSESIDWSLLQSQYFSDTMYHNHLSKMVDDQDVSYHYNLFFFCYPEKKTSCLVSYLPYKFCYFRTAS